MSGKPLSESAKCMVLNAVAFFEAEKRENQTIIPFDKARDRVCAALGISPATVTNVIKESKAGPIRPPKLTLHRPKPITTINESLLSSIRNTLNHLCKEKKSLTLSSILTELKEQDLFHGSKSSLSRILNEMQFQWNTDNNKRSADFQMVLVPETSAEFFENEITAPQEIQMNLLTETSSTSQEFHTEVIKIEPFESILEKNEDEEISEVNHESQISSSKSPTNDYSNSKSLDEKNNFAKKEFDSEKKLPCTAFNFDQISENEKLVSLYTGLPNAHVFNALYELVENIPINYYLGWSVEVLPRKDQLFLTLMMLRQNFPYEDLALRFNIPQNVATNTIVTWIHVLHEVLHTGLMCDIPSRDKNRTCLPNCFSTFTNCRMILDCPEIATTNSKTHHKPQHTWKALICLTPNGVVTYVSTLYPASMSDKKIVQHSGILHKMETGDLILTNKDFCLSDVLPPGVNLKVLSSLEPPHFAEEQVHCTETINSARMYIKRIIERIQLYKILNSVPVNLTQHAGFIVQVIGALTNLQELPMQEVNSSDYKKSV